MGSTIRRSLALSCGLITLVEVHPVINKAKNKLKKIAGLRGFMVLC
jgi:hypothetical protein